MHSSSSSPFVPVVMENGTALSQLDRHENMQNTKRVAPIHTFLATLAQAGQVNFSTSTLATQHIQGRASLRAYDINGRTIFPLHVILIMCLSRFFPESVCTAVHGVGYSLYLYYLLLVLQSANVCAYTTVNRVSFRNFVKGGQSGDYRNKRGQQQK